MVECFSSNHPLLNRTSLPTFYLHSSRRAEKCGEKGRVAWWSVAPWPIHSRIWRCYPGSTERTERSGAGRPSWILASSVSRPFSIKPAGLATFHYDNKIYRIWGLEGGGERARGRDASRRPKCHGWRARMDGLSWGSRPSSAASARGREASNQGRRLAFCIHICRSGQKVL